MTLRTSTGPSRRSDPIVDRRLRQSEAARGARDLRMGVLLVLLGGGLLAGLFQASQTLDFDGLLATSTSIYNVIAGLRGIGMGIGQMLLGLTQMLGFAALAAVSIAAVLAMLSGAVRIGYHALPLMGPVWQLLAQGLLRVLQSLALPLVPGHQGPPQRATGGEADLDQPQRSGRARHRRAS